MNAMPLLQDGETRTNRATAVDANYGPEESAIRTYMKAAEERALALDNRESIRLTADGKL